MFSQQPKSQAQTPSIPGFLASHFQPSATRPSQEQEKAEVNSNIQSNLQEVLCGDPVLDGAQIETKVDDIAITLTGTVNGEGQHRRALQLASQYSQYRKIVDKLVVQ
jgi:osmotically-inducible protein OsmY